MNRIAFHTNAFVWSGLDDIETIADYAISTGFDAIELGPGIVLDEKRLASVNNRIPISAMIYCRNFIDDDGSLAKRERAELYRRMEIASSLGVEKIIISTGISRELSLPAEGGCNPLLSLEKVVDFLSEAVEKAEKLGLHLLLENCPMYRNIATSPYMWRKIFSSIDSPNLGLCYDPSHFVWQMIDVYAPAKEFGDRIKHVHVKNTVIRKDKLNEVGILHNTAKDKGFEENQWWYHAISPEGEIDWEKMISILPPDVDLSFETEDYRYECNVERIKKALAIQLEHIKGILKA